MATVSLRPTTQSQHSRLTMQSASRERGEFDHVDFQLSGAGVDAVRMGELSEKKNAGRRVEC